MTSSSSSFILTPAGAAWKPDYIAAQALTVKRSTPNVDGRFLDAF